MSTAFIICSHIEAFVLEGGVVHSSHRSIHTCDPLVYPDQYGSVIKYGQCFFSLNDALAWAYSQGRNCGLIGTASKDFGIAIKRACPEVRRFKQVDLMHTDREVMTKGVELVQWGSMVGVVTHRQPIALYEAIDFEKPFRSMTMGMLPAKVGAILLSIALALRPSSSVTIYDPFVGSGTIPMLALARGYHALGSDIAHVTACKRAMQWRVDRHPSFVDLSWSIWYHDATDAKNKPLARFATHVVTEGWLGPIITSRHHQHRIWEAARDVGDFVRRRVPQIQTNHPDCPLVFCVPWYTALDHDVLDQRWSHILTPLGVVMTSFVYSRPKQSVGRRVVYRYGS
ncbi:MAG: hypothetical protein NZL83_02800 [Candidatus Absconditabacterales bacterium]|nr:hypothetical protein [Candidatus Absconditabacterales bacterium]